MNKFWSMTILIIAVIVVYVFGLYVYNFQDGWAIAIIILVSLLVGFASEKIDAKFPPKKKEIPHVQTVTDTVPAQVFATISTNPSINCTFTPLTAQRLIGAGIFKIGGGLIDMNLSSLITISKNLGITPKLVFVDENEQETPAETKQEYNPNKVELGNDGIDLEQVIGMDIKSEPNKMFYYLGFNGYETVNYSDKFTPDDAEKIYEQWRKL